MKPEIIQKQPIAETKFLNLVMTTYRDKNGKENQWVSAERANNANAVVIVPIIGLKTSTPKLVIIREYRVPIQGYEHGFPAGLVDMNETIIDAAERELKEETGLSIKTIIRGVSPVVYNSAGLTNEGCQIVYVEAEGTPTSKYTEDTEDISVEILNQAEVADLINESLKGKVYIGAKAFIIMERFINHGDI